MTILVNDQGLLGVIPAAVCTVFILFMDVKDPVRFKLPLTLSCIPWMIYHYFIRSYVGAIFDFASTITNVITLYSMFKEKSKETNLNE